MASKLRVITNNGYILTETTCIICGKIFMAKSSDNDICSDHPHQPIKKISMKDMCEHIVKADIFIEPKTAQQIFNYSPTGELWRVFEWYDIACDKLWYKATKQ